MGRADGTGCDYSHSKRGGGGVMSQSPNTKGSKGEENTVQVSITLTPVVRDAVDKHLDGELGNSRSDAIKVALAIYLSERGLLDLGESV